MGDTSTAGVGKIGWVDMSVANADAMRDFYTDVVGFRPGNVSMGDYDDYTMCMPETGDAVAGVCHARGGNSDLPGGWLVYFVVADVDDSAAKCVAGGGRLVVPVRGLAGGRFCVIEDPNGATCALFQP